MYVYSYGEVVDISWPSVITDPMLPSGETDLIGAPSDIDSEKVQGQVTLDISSPDITASSS